MALSRKHVAAAAAAAALALPLAAPAASAVPNDQTVVSGLANPRGVAVAANGDVYVAEAGSGGSTELGPIHLGPTGQITRYRPATDAATVVADGFISVATEEGVLGLGGVTTQGSTLYGIVGGAPQFLAGAPSSAAVDLGLAQLGQVIKVTPGGRQQSIAGVGEANFDWTATQPGLVDPPDGTQDANHYGVLATPKGVLVADTGANNVDLVRLNGSITILTRSGVPHNAASPISDAVPTCVVPDGTGGYLVGTLDRQVIRMTSSGDLTGIPLSGSDPLFTIGGCASDGHGGLYAVDTASFFFGQSGSVVHIDGSGAYNTVVGGLFAPGGVAVAKDGRSLFVTVNSVSPDQGQLIQVPLA